MLNLQHLRDRPRSDFRPFKTWLSGGRSFDVPHPDFIAVGRGVRLVDSEDGSHAIDALRIVSIEGPENVNGNGR
jgi:hypothetical protein